MMFTLDEPDEEQRRLNITPLHRAITVYSMAVFSPFKDYTPEQILEDIIAQTEDINVRDYKGDTALHYAASIQLTGAAKILLKAGAEVDALNNNHETPLYTCVRGTPKKEVVDLLLNAGADPYVQGLNRTLLEYVKENPSRARLDAFRQYFTDEEIRGVEEGIAEQDLLTEQLHELRRKSKQKKS